jgi:hypothetical protein
VVSQTRLGNREADRESSNEGDYAPEEADSRKIVERQIRQRRGQQQFRDSLIARYGDRCLVTGCRALAVVEAAHIKPYRGERDNRPSNGLLLRSDIHTLFDLNLLGIEPTELRVELHPELARVSPYRALSGKRLRCAKGKTPSPNALRLRYSEFRTEVSLRTVHFAAACRVIKKTRPPLATETDSARRRPTRVSAHV